MSLSKQVHLYSIDTSSFYNEDEMFIHNRMLKLYNLRTKLKITQLKNKKNPDIKFDSWKLKSVNRLLRKYKKKLVSKLDPLANTEIIRDLRLDAIKDKNVISLFDSSTTRALNLKINQLTEELFIVNVFFFQVFDNIMKNGFMYKNQKYIFLCASAGQIRTKKAVFIKESSFNKIEGQITCGLSLKEINKKGGCNPNKYLAYFSLSNSATDVWEEFDIDKSIVVEDFETNVLGTVDYIDDKTYEITRKEMEVPIPHMDGCGTMLDKGTRMVRLPWVKGLMVEFPFDKFIQEKCPNGSVIVKDIYGKSYDILKEDIRYIFTKSQFKMAKYYDSWDDYKTRFKANNCQACYCNLEEDYIPNAKLNYQFIQSLTDITDKEIDKLIKPTIEDIEKIGKDFKTTMRLLGAEKNNSDPIYMQQALMKYPEILRDAYNKEILKDVKRSLIKQAKSGRVKVNGGYRFLSPDLYAFCEWLFLRTKNPQGLLESGKVYCKGYKDNIELACLRSPHLYREWPIRNNVRNEEIDKWFGVTQCIYTSSHDLISKILQFDNDGDKALVVKDNNLTKVAKRNMIGIVPLYYDMKKAQPVQLNNDTIFQGMTTAYSTGNIGPYSNNISKIWNGEKVGEEEINVIRWLCMENNYCIDTAKTLYMPTRPTEVDEIIKSYTNTLVPNFFIYAKDKTKDQVNISTNSTMNRLMNKIPDIQITYCDTIEKFDYKMLMNNSFQIKEEEQKDIVNIYDSLSRKRNRYRNTKEDKRKKEEDLFIFQSIRQDLIKESEKSAEYIVDCLVKFLYTKRTNSIKQVLWASFGDIINLNLDNNLLNADPYCPVCGKRFKVKTNKEFCSEGCFEIHRREYFKHIKREQRE